MVVVVSEERGEVSVAERGKLEKVATPTELKKRPERFTHRVRPRKAADFRRRLLGDRHRRRCPHRACLRLFPRTSFAVPRKLWGGAGPLPSLRRKGPFHPSSFILHPSSFISHLSSPCQSPLFALTCGFPALRRVWPGGNPRIRRYTGPKTGSGRGSSQTGPATPDPRRRRSCGH